MPSDPIGKIMTAEVEQVTPDAPIADVAERMRRKRISCVLVCDAGEPIGIISERDLLRVFADHVRDGRFVECARDLMSVPLITIDETAPVFKGVETIGRHRVRRLVVVDADGRLAGIVTQSDLMNAYVHEVERQRDDLDRQVRERTLELEETNRMLESMSHVDSLMGIGNRRAMELNLDTTHERKLRYGSTYSIALLDVDHFKAYNDTYGHIRGDDALRLVAEAISSQLRASDELYRYGGEEILVLLPETRLDDAVQAAERARAIVEALELEHSTAPRGRVTLSAGVATVGTAPDECWKPTILEADMALYRAKAAGRNRVERALASDAAGEAALPHSKREES